MSTAVVPFVPYQEFLRRLRSPAAVARQRTRQRFLHSRASHPVSLPDILGMKPAAIDAAFARARWGETKGRAVCPKCQARRPYWLRDYRRWKCRACKCSFSVISKTWLSDAKVPLKEYLAALLIFVNCKNGISSLELAAHLGWGQRSAFYFLQNVRRCILENQIRVRLAGDVEADGAFFGGHYEQHNTISMKSGKFERRRRFGNRRVVVVARQRNGRTITAVGAKESDCAFAITSRIEHGSRIVVDETRAWDSMKSIYPILKINHSVSFSDGEACTNLCETFFACLRRMQIGTHHRMSGALLNLYAAEMAWRIDFSGESNEQRLGRLLSMLLQQREAKRA